MLIVNEAPTVHTRIVSDLRCGSLHAAGCRTGVRGQRSGNTALFHLDASQFCSLNTSHSAKLGLRLLDATS